jgi:hypothetical protein
VGNLRRLTSSEAEHLPPLGLRAGGRFCVELSVAVSGGNLIVVVERGGFALSYTGQLEGMQ